MEPSFALAHRGNRRATPAQPVPAPVPGRALAAVPWRGQRVRVYLAPSRIPFERQGYPQREGHLAEVRTAAHPVRIGSCILPRHHVVHDRLGGDFGFARPIQTAQIDQQRRLAPLVLAHRLSSSFKRPANRHHDFDLILSISVDQRKPETDFSQEPRCLDPPLPQQE